MLLTGDDSLMMSDNSTNLSSGGMSDVAQVAGQAELIIPCCNEDNSEARMARQAKCKEQTEKTTKVFKYFCCTFIMLVLALILIPVIATEILNKQQDALLNGDGN